MQLLHAAVAAAYGWPADISDDEAVRKLQALRGRARRASCDAIRSVDGFGEPVDSRSKSGNQRGNHDPSTGSKSRPINNLRRFDDSRCWGSQHDL